MLAKTSAHHIEIVMILELHLNQINPHYHFMIPLPTFCIPLALKNYEFCFMSWKINLYGLSNIVANKLK